MNRFFALVACLCLVLSFVPTALQAQEADEKEAIEALSENIDEQMKIATEERQKSAEETYAKMTTLMNELPELEQQHFLMAYSNYNMIETVKIVQKDVGIAIGKCGENNPEMKQALNDRFELWNGAVDPLIKEAHGNFNNMLVAQEYASKKELKDIFSSVDDTREKTYDQIEKIPVTTPEACQYLLSKMDETEESMVGILRSTLFSFPKISARLEQRAAQKEQKQKERDNQKKERDPYE